MTEALHYQSIMQVSAALRSGKLSPVDLLEAMLDRIAALDPKLHSYLLVTAEAARIEARRAAVEIATGRYRGPLHGVPIAFKDLNFTKGVATTFGMRVHKDFVPEFDGTPVHRLKVAGAVTLGKLNLHEGAFGEHHPDWEKPLNPWNMDYWPGGSSSGSGVATASGMCFASTGSDTGGSIRFPSHACSVTGVKPTWGRVSRHGAFPLSESLDTIGPMARSAADCAAMLAAMAGYDAHDPTSLRAPVPDFLAALDGVSGARGMKIGLDITYVGQDNDTETIAVIEAAAAVFAAIGAEVVPVKLPDVTDVANAQLAYCQVESAIFHKQAYLKAPDDFGRHLGKAVADGMAYDPVRYAKHQIDRDIFKGRLRLMFEEVDAILAPVMPGVGVKYADTDAFMANVPKLLRYTCPFNMSGSPTVTMPGGFSSLDLPIGFQLVGPHLSEDRLLAASHAFQQATDWHLRRPPVG